MSSGSLRNAAGRVSPGGSISYQKPPESSTGQQESFEQQSDAPLNLKTKIPSIHNSPPQNRQISTLEPEIEFSIEKPIGVEGRYGTTMFEDVHGNSFSDSYMTPAAQTQQPKSNEKVLVQE